MRNLLLLPLCLLLYTCEEAPAPRAGTLADYISQHGDLAPADLVACAAGRPEGLNGNAEVTTDVYFYPVAGATDFRYFETSTLADSADFSRYVAKPLPDEAVFNGYLRKFLNRPFAGERMGVVTYRTPGKLHVCTPIRLKTNVKPTELNDALITVEDNDASPTFRWSDGEIRENVIYFQVIADAAGNLISGTYTTEPTFTFYDLDNVVFNITNADVLPDLTVGERYSFTLMGVSEDNWVNLIGSAGFVVE